MTSIKKIICLFATATVCATAFSQESRTEFNREPLVQKQYAELPLGSIRPQGWLKDHLERMAAGMTGNLDHLYEKVMGDRNGWLGGDGDVWERGPYWIDGLLPLAWQLDDDALKAKVMRWVEWSLSSQQDDGYFGPATDNGPEFGLQRDNSHDWWPKMVMLKVLQQYYGATSDSRVIELMTRYFRYQLEHLPDCPLNNWTYWGQMRGGDNLMVVLWLYNITGDSFLLDLAEIIHSHTYDWTGKFLAGEMLRTPYTMHCVNLGQGFKEPAIWYQMNGKASQIEALHKAVEDMRHGIGLPTGLWAGDELIRFGDPVRGSELCTAVEMMFSLENILSITGDGYWGDYLEKVAYNVLPTQITDNFDARQYYQQTNQIKISLEERNFVTCYRGTDQLFGILAGYPCCTSNLHQGWPKLVQNLWLASFDEGLAALVYGPSSVKATVRGGHEVEIVETTDYPMEETVRFTVKLDKSMKKGVSFPLYFRIPQWSTGTKVSINGIEVPCRIDRSTSVAAIDRTWLNGDVMTIEFDARVDVILVREGCRDFARTASLCPQARRDMGEEGDAFSVQWLLWRMVLSGYNRRSMELLSH